MKNIKPYFVKENGAEWSVLSFHYNRQQAKVLASRSWLTEFEYTRLRVRRADNDYMMFAKKSEPHIVDTWDCRVPYSGDCPTWEDALLAKKLRYIKLRHKILNGKATDADVEQWWAEYLKDPEQLELMKTEINLREVLKGESDEAK